MSDNRDVARARCHALFNNAAFADVLVTADSLLDASAGGTVTTRQIAARLGISDSVVRPVMVRLLAAGLLDELPKTGAANGPRLFHRRSGDQWTNLVQLVHDIGSNQADRSGQTAGD